MNVRARYQITGTSASAVVESIERGIREGRLLPGAGLPAVRSLASTLGLSPATVGSAYRTLRVRGLLTGRGRRGSRVTLRPPLPAPRGAPPPAGLRNLYDGNPDPARLPLLRRHFMKTLVGPPRLYGGPSNVPSLLAIARRDFAADGIPAEAVGVFGGAIDGFERVLQAQLRPGDRIAVEDPGHVAVLDLVVALGLSPEPVAVDERGMKPEVLAQALRAGARGIILTPRAQNPTGAALDERRTAELRKVLDRWPEALLIEDDHAGPVAGTKAYTLSARRERWAVVRSVSKSLGPDLRLAVMAGDETTLARAEGRQAVGAGWVSHMLQRVVADLWNDPATEERLSTATEAYAARRQALLEALAAHGISAWGRSGFNVWIPVAEEAETMSALAARGWAVRAGEPYRLKSPPAIRITISTLRPQEAMRVAADVAAAIRKGGLRSTA